LVGEVSQEEGGIEKLGDVFDASRRKFLEDLIRDEVVARGSFGRKVVDYCLNFSLFESWRGVRVSKGIPKDGRGIPPHEVPGLLCKL
jgi:hypothetical protein